MEQYFSLLSDCSLFSGLDRESVRSALRCFQAAEIKIPKGTALFHEGDPVGNIGIVLSGVIQISRTDLAGNREIVLTALPGELFGEVHLIAGLEQAPASAVAALSATRSFKTVL